MLMVLMFTNFIILCFWGKTRKNAQKKVAFLQTFYIGLCCGLAPASNKGLRGHSMAPPPTGVGRTMGRKRQNWWVGMRAV